MLNTRQQAEEFGVGGSAVCGVPFQNYEMEALRYAIKIPDIERKSLGLVALPCVFRQL